MQQILVYFDSQQIEQKRDRSMRRQIRLSDDGTKQIKTNFAKGKKKEVDEPYDFMIKLIIIGDSGVGKTNIISRFCTKNSEDVGKFREHHVATIGVDFSVKTIEIGDKKLKLQIWDTAGQERFKTITQTYYKGAAGIILAYSVDSEQSFKSIEKWMAQVNNRTSEGVIKVLVANKIDLEESDHLQTPLEQRARKISTEQGRDFAEKNQLDYMQVSAKNNEGISEIFYRISSAIKERIQSEQVIANQDGQVSRTITLDSKRGRNMAKVTRGGIQFNQQAEPNFVYGLKQKLCNC